jgi:hypothetical protein
VYWDAALTQPAALPVRTRGGYPVNAGTPARLYVGSDYSIQVQNKNGSVVYSAPQATERYSDPVISGIDSSEVTFLQAGSGAVVRTAQSKMRDVVSVKDFGAVGDGVADDTAAFISAITFANGRKLTGNGTFLLPNIASIPITTSICLEGDRQNSFILDFNGNGYFNLAGAGASFVANNVRFTNMHSAVYVLGVNNLKDIYVDGCIFDNFLYGGISLLTFEIQNVQITNNIFRNGLGAGEVSAVRLGRDSNTPSAVQDTMGRYLISGNIFDDIVSSTTGEEAHGVLCFGREIICTSNLFRKIHNIDFTISSEAFYAKARYCNVSNNIFLDAGYAQGAIVIKGSIRDTPSSGGPETYAHVIEGNVIAWTSTTAVSREGIYSYSSDMLITNNYIENATLAIHNGNENTRPANVTITNNHIRNSSAGAIYFTQSYGKFVINNNTIDGLIGSPTNLFGILFSAADNCDLIVIEGNTIHADDLSTPGTSIRGIQVGVVAAKTIDRCTIRDNVVDITNSTKTVFAINITTIAQFNTLLIENNDVSAQTLDNNQLQFNSASVRPSRYSFKNNGTVPDESNFDANFRGSVAYTYDYTVDPNGSIVIGFLPPNAVVTKTSIFVAQQPTSAGTPTVSLSIDVDDVNGLLAPTSLAGLPVGWVSGIQDGAVTNFANKTTSTRSVYVTVSVGNLTAGRLTVYLDYVIVP